MKERGRKPPTTDFRKSYILKLEKLIIIIIIIIIIISVFIERLSI